MVIISFCDEVQAQFSYDSDDTAFTQYFSGFEYTITGRSIRFIGKTPSQKFQTFRFYGGFKVFQHPEKLFAIYYSYSADLFTKLHYTVDDTGKEKKRVGLGITPAGYTFAIPVTKNIQLESGFSGGFSVFDNYFPDKKGIPLNFTYAVDAALLLKISNQSWFMLRSRYYHHSNAEIGKTNPGLDLIMISGGMHFAF